MTKRHVKDKKYHLLGIDVTKAARLIKKHEPKFWVIGVIGAFVMAIWISVDSASLFTTALFTVKLAVKEA